MQILSSGLVVLIVVISKPPLWTIYGTGYSESKKLSNLLQIKTPTLIVHGHFDPLVMRSNLKQVAIKTLTFVLLASLAIMTSQLRNVVKFYRTKTSSTRGEKKNVKIKLY